MSDKYLANGVKARADGMGGQSFSNLHRERLNHKHLMQDFDAFVGFEVVLKKAENNFFIEYEPDSYENRMMPTRRFAIVAMFDQKNSLATARHDGSKLSKDLYCDVARKLSFFQPIPPRFFWVIGPYELQEVGINTGLETGSLIRLTPSNSWDSYWTELGLTQARAQLKSFLVNPPQHGIVKRPDGKVAFYWFGKQVSADEFNRRLQSTQS